MSSRFQRREEISEYTKLEAERDCLRRDNNRLRAALKEIYNYGVFLGYGRPQYEITRKALAHEQEGK